MKEYRACLTEKEQMQLLQLIQNEYIDEYKKAEKSCTRKTYDEHMRKHFELKSLYIAVATAKEV